MAAQDDKFTVSVAAKVDEDLARLIRQTAKRCGLKDGQLIRLILERFSALISEHWHEYINMPVFLNHIFFDSKQLNLFLKTHSGLEQDRQN